MNILKWLMKREPDFIIGDYFDPILLRWHLIPRNRFFNLYLHRFLKSDDDRALHDHPWHYVSFLLKGGYVEWTDWRNHEDKTFGYSRKYFKAGDILFRGPRSAHRIELIQETWMLPSDREVITLFMTGPKLRDWGFWCPKGWVHWRDFTSKGRKGESLTGRGCGEI